MSLCLARLTLKAQDDKGRSSAGFILTCDRDQGHTGPHYLVRRFGANAPALQWSDDGRDVRAAWHDDLSTEPDPIRFGTHYNPTAQYPGAIPERI